MLDEKDKRIIDELQRDSKQTTGRMAKRTGIPTTTVHNRIKKLENEGIITGYTATVDHGKLGKGIHAVILINVSYTLPDGTHTTQKEIAKRIKTYGAHHVSIVTGGVDIIAHIRTADVQALNDFVIDKLRSVPGVDKTQTMIVLSEA